jgi:hypothetical protein
MKNLAFSLLAAVLLISACEKDDNKTTAAGSFTFNNEAAISIPYGFIQDYGVDGNDISFSDINIATDTAYAGKVSYLQFSLATLTPGTYTYLSNDSTGYDATKNFSFAILLYKADMAEGSIDGDTGTNPGNPTGGTITLKKDGETYTFTYTIQFGTSKVTGSYVGKPLYIKEN